ACLVLIVAAWGIGRGHPLFSHRCPPRSRAGTQQRCRMIRIGFLGMLVGLMSLNFFTDAASADDPAKADDAPIITIERSGGFVDPAQNPLANYRFTVAKDGGWELKPGRGKSKKGKLDPDAVTKWLKEIEEKGFDKLKSKPALGAADESYMDITIRAKNKKDQKRIPLEEKLAQAIEKKVVELAKPDK